MCRPQTFSHYPSWPAPLRMPLVTVPEHECAYFSDRQATIRAFRAGQMPPEVYHAFMDAGFRRSGGLIYQPACRGCRLCIPIRVPVQEFTPSKSQRRCWKRNADLSVAVAPPVATDEKYRLYLRYVRDWHGRDLADESREGFERFLYESPVQSIEFEYREPAGRLAGVGICDVCDRSLSSVYFYFDPAERRRGLGTFGALCEIDHARQGGVPHYYIGYWVRGCRAMDACPCTRRHDCFHDRRPRESTATKDSDPGGG